MKPQAEPPSSSAWSAAYVLASALFFASGFTGLSYEIIWFKHFAQVWGSSSLATAAVVGSFLLGLGVGARLFGRAADRVKSPLFWYGACELAVGVLALLIPLEIALLRAVSGALYPALFGLPLAHYAARLALTFLVIGPPTILMGGTLPLMVRQLTTEASGLRRSTGWLYAVNTIGAASGCYVCGFHLLARFGLDGTNTITAVLNLSIGALALIVARFLAAPPSSAEEAVERGGTAASPAERSPLLLHVVAVVSGSAALALQIVWVRELVLVLGGTTYAFSAVLFVVLVGIGLGSLAFRIWAGTKLRLELVPVIGLPVLVLSTMAGQWLIEPLTLWIARIRPERASEVANALVCVRASAALELAPALVMGLLFPYLVHLTRRRANQAGEAVGRIYAANTLGTIAGASLTSALLIPALGSLGTVRLALALYVAVFFLLFPTSWGRLIGIESAALLLVFVLVALPQHDPRVTNAGGYMYGVDVVKTISSGDSVLMFEEGRMASVLVTNETRAPDQVYLRVDGKVDASSGGDMDTQLGLAYFPRFLRPKARDVCVIGYGSGSTAGASGLFPGTKVTCCEIEPAVYAASRFFEKVNHDPPSQPGFRLVLDDGRNFLQGTRERFDLIISEPSNPWMPGIANLFTQNFYETVRSRLSPGGLIAQWIQVYDFSLSEYALIVRTIGDVFPHVALIRLSGSDTILLASMEPIEASRELADEVQLQVNAFPAVLADLDKTWGTRDVRSLLLRHWFLDGAGLARLVGREPRGPPGTSGSGLNTDLNMRLEFDAPLRLFVEHKQPIPIVDQELVAAARASWFAALWRALGAEPRQIDALLTTMHVLRDQGRTAEAQELLAFAVEIAPEDPLIQTERLVDELAKKRSLGPADLAQLDTLSTEVVGAIGFRLSQAQSHEAAAALFRRLVERTPRSWTNWVRLGVSLEALARWDEADAAYRKALQIEPANPQAQQAFRSFQVKRQQAR